MLADITLYGTDYPLVTAIILPWPFVFFASIAEIGEAPHDHYVVQRYTEATTWRTYWLNYMLTTVTVCVGLEFLMDSVTSYTLLAFAKEVAWR